MLFRSPTGPPELWSSPPFVPTRDGEGWLYGRGAGDMKAGLAAMVGAVAALRELGVAPRSALTLQSVVEEECTGNGALQCAIAGQRADGAVVVEPFGDAVNTSQVGVLWFDVRIAGTPAHVGDAQLGASAIERAFGVIGRLRGLEAELNADPPPPYDAYQHPITLNIGMIEGGDWRSTIASACTVRCRLALFPGDEPASLRTRIESTVAAAAADDPVLAEMPPVVTYDGFAAHGYTVPSDAPILAAARDALGAARGSTPATVPSTATSDTRALGLAAQTPAVCIGPYAERIHATSERVWLPSVHQTVTALTLLDRKSVV